MIEVRYHRVGKSEVVRREDELVGPSLILLQHSISANSCLSSLNNTCTYSTHMAALLLCLVDDSASLSTDVHLLRVHLVLGKVLNFDVVEVAQTAVQSDIRKVKPVAGAVTAPSFLAKIH